MGWDPSSPAFLIRRLAIWSVYFDHPWHLPWQLTAAHAVPAMQPTQLYNEPTDVISSGPGRDHSRPGGPGGLNGLGKDPDETG